MKSSVLHFLTLLFLTACCYNCSPEDNDVLDIVQLMEAIGIQNPTLNFNLPLDKDTLLITEKGIGIYIEKHSFIDQDGNPVKDEVHLSVQEFFNGFEIFGSPVSTIHPEGLLETRGMFNINAYAAGKKVQLANNKIIRFFLPGELDQYANAKLFYGRKSNTGVIDWILPSEEPRKDIDAINWKKQIAAGLHFNFSDEEELDKKQGFFRKTPAFRDSFLRWIDLPITEQKKILEKPIAVYWTLFKDGDFEVYAIQAEIDERTKQHIVSNLNAIPNLAPFFRETQPTDVNGGFSLIFYEHELTLFDNFTLQADRLGWINCDIFLSIDRPLTDMIVVAPNKSGVMKVIFKNYKTMVTGILKNDGYFHFAGLPEGEAINIVNVYPDGSTTLFSLTESIVKPKIIELSPTKPVSIQELEWELNAIF